MSSVFDSAFASSHAPPSRPSSSSHRSSAARPPLLRAVAAWLGLGGGERRVRAKAPARRRSWDQHKLEMLQAGDKMLARARSNNEPISLAVFDLNDLPELESVFGSAIAREVMTQVGFRLQGMAGSKGLVMRTGATVFTVLMPGFGRERAQQAIERTLGSPCCIELDADEHEIVLVPDFKLHTFGSKSAPLAQAYADLLRDISAAQQVERRRQRYLQRERESHTRPQDLQVQEGIKPTPVPHPPFRQVDPTIPMPLKQ